RSVAAQGRPVDRAPDPLLLQPAAARRGRSRGWPDRHGRGAVTTYPVSLTLAGRRVLVVGGGRVATRRLTGLLEAGARVDVVAPRLSAKITRWAAEGLLSAAHRAFGPDDVAGAWLCLAATDDPEVDREVVRA